MGRSKTESPTPDVGVLFWAGAFVLERGRRPKAHELPGDVGAALGKKIFAGLDYRDAHDKKWTDDEVYCVVLDAHEVEPSDWYLVKMGRLVILPNEVIKNEQT